MSNPVTRESTPMLAEIRRALGRTERKKPIPLPAISQLSSDESSEQIVNRFVEEATAVLARVHKVRTSEEAVARVAEICLESGAGEAEVAVSGAALLSEINLPARLSSHNIATLETAGFSADKRDDLISRLASCVVGITAVDCAIAETGTIVLSSDEEHSLLVSLLPPVHIAIIKPEQVKPSITAAVSWLNRERMGRLTDACRSASFITGPSRTGDVELTLSIGVHGPKELHLIIIDAQAKSQKTA